MGIEEEILADVKRQGIEQGFAIGFPQGLEQGIKQGQKQIIKHLLRKAISVNEIQETTGYSIDLIFKTKEDVLKSN